MLKVVVAVGTALTLVLSSQAASAQGTDEFGSYGGLERQGQRESPQNAAFELRFGPYKPDVDSELGGARPFRDTFGTSTRYMIGIEVDWQALRLGKFASVGPGIGWGYTKFGADALLTDGSGGRSAQETSLEIMPMHLVGVARLDYLARETSIPLAAYGKLGVGYALWWTGDGDDTARAPDGTLGRGNSYGMVYALGGMLLLDILDRSSAIEMDNMTGVNNTYFFVEWYVSQLDGFGSGSQMRVGTNTWLLGLALEI